MKTLFHVAMGPIEERAKVIDASWRQQRAQILNDRNLSDEGKQRQLADNDARRVTQVAALQEQAHGELVEAKAKHAVKLQAAREKELTDRRALLGDDIIIRQWERIIAKADGSRMQKAWETAVGWERDVIRELALTELVERIDRNELGGGVVMAYNAIRGTGDDLAQYEAMAVELERDAPRWIDELDRDAKRRDVAGKFGLSYDVMTANADQVQA